MTPMRNEPTNLLPIERRRTLAREYYVRLSVAVVSFVTALALVSIVLLIPTYVLLAEGARTKEAHLISIESALSSTNEATLSTRLAALNSNAATLSALARAPSVSATIRSALAVSRPGITLFGFVYTPATLALSGVAATRDALRGYQLALSSMSFTRSADLPVSAYAKDSNIPFTITITLAP